MTAHIFCTDFSPLVFLFLCSDAAKRARKEGFTSSTDTNSLLLIVRNGKTLTLFTVKTQCPFRLCSVARAFRRPGAARRPSPDLIKTEMLVSENPKVLNFQISKKHAICVFSEFAPFFSAFWCSGSQQGRNPFSGELETKILENHE